MDLALEVDGGSERDGFLLELGPATGCCGFLNWESLVEVALIEVEAGLTWDDWMTGGLLRLAMIPSSSS